MAQAQAQGPTNEELCTRIQQGESGLSGQLWEQVRRFVLRQARRYLPRDGSSELEVADFENAGFIAMMTAVSGFDTAAGCKFTTYLDFHLRRYFGELRGWGRRPDLLNSPGTQSLEAALPGTDDYTLSDTLPDSGAEEAFDRATDRVAAQQLCEIVLRCMKRLDLEQAEVLRRHYFGGQTLQQIAEQDGTSKAGIWQYERRALRRLRAFKEIRRLGMELYADHHTNFYRHTGIQAFQNGAPSAVERTVENRERLIESIFLSMEETAEAVCDRLGWAPSITPEDPERQGDDPLCPS